jgi:hypothetical protein
MPELRSWIGTGIKSLANDRIASGRRRDTGSRRVPAPAADDHIGILVDGLLQQPVDVVELVLAVGVDGDQEIGRGARARRS